MSREEKAYIVPFFAFMGGLALIELIGKFAQNSTSFWLTQPHFWVYPLQTIVCGALLFYYRKHYPLRPLGQPLLTLGAGVLVLVLWISPQAFFGQPLRLKGFDPTVFENQPALYWTTLGLRFVRLVIVVPLLEEIFWRGWLMRYLIHPHALSVPFGTYQLKAFVITAGMFALAHFGPDLIPALITGVLYNALACRTKSLASCVVAHALTNLLLGIYILKTGQWGFW